ncbi:hypothetical protein [Microvirga pudoricolor]|uniref:hypothetical protein n=1 Tax=Microvirga pudoricolor TaxID=2778729 RepID=UPI0019519AC3|nr:hypothetical protein [Microvirga pudoricolor]MBM6596313.1 hypothetical protein [Microvirga pudoricolor]
MTEDEIEVVAEALAKAAGMAWCSGYGRTSPQRLVSERYRDRARTAIATIDRLRQNREAPCRQDNAAFEEDGSGDTLPRPPVKLGAMVIYKPHGDRRGYSCRVVKIEGSRAYLQPIIKACTGWISIENLGAVSPEPATSGE